MWSDWLVSCDCGFQSLCPLMEKGNRLMEASWWERLTEGEIGSCSDGRGHVSKSLIQFSVDGWGCVPSLLFQFSSVHLCLTLFLGLQHDRPPCPSQTPRVYSNSCPLSQWCHPIISSSVIPFRSCPQSFPASGSFPMSRLFTSSG